MTGHDIGGATGVELAQQRALRCLERLDRGLDRFHAGQQVVIRVEVLVEAGDFRRQLGQHCHVEHVFECTGRV